MFVRFLNKRLLHFTILGKYNTLTFIAKVLSRWWLAICCCKHYPHFALYIGIKVFTIYTTSVQKLTKTFVFSLNIYLFFCILWFRDSVIDVINTKYVFDSCCYNVSFFIYFGWMYPIGTRYKFFNISLFLIRDCGIIIIGMIIYELYCIDDIHNYVVICVCKSPLS